MRWLAHLGCSCGSAGSHGKIERTLRGTHGARAGGHVFAIHKVEEVRQEAVRRIKILLTRSIAIEMFV